MCKGKCRRAEEIEEGDRNRERERDVERENTETKEKKGRHYNAALQSRFLCSWPERNLKWRWSSSRAKSAHSV